MHTQGVHLLAKPFRSQTLAGHDRKITWCFVDQRKEADQIDFAAPNFELIAQQCVVDARCACHHFDKQGLGQGERGIGVWGWR